MASKNEWKNENKDEVISQSFSSLPANCRFPAHSALLFHESQTSAVHNERQATPSTNDWNPGSVPDVNIDDTNPDYGTRPHGRHPFHWEENIAGSDQILAQNAENLGEFVVNNGALHSPTDFQTLNQTSNLEFGPGNRIDNTTPYYAAKPDAYNVSDWEAAVGHSGAFGSNNVENGGGYMLGNGDLIFGFAQNSYQPTMDNGSFNNTHLFPTRLHNFSTVRDSYAMASDDDMLGPNGGYQPSNNYELDYPMSSFGQDNFGQQFPAPSLDLQQTTEFDPTGLMFNFGSEILSQQTPVARTPSNLTTSPFQDIPSTSHRAGIALVPQPAARATVNPTSRQFGCGHCGKRFERKGDCDRHHKIHAPPQLHCAAPGCSKAFRRKDKRADHQRRVHGM